MGQPLYWGVNTFGKKEVKIVAEKVKKVETEEGA